MEGVGILSDRTPSATRSEVKRRPRVPAGRDPTDVWPVAASTDDCIKYNTTFSVVLVSVFVTHLSLAIEGGYRFLALDIEQGSTIVSAYLQIMPYDDWPAGGTATVKGEAVDDAATFSDLTDFDGRTRTAASVTWNPGVWATGVWATSPNLASILQEIIDRPGWSSGNALVLLTAAPIGPTHSGDSYDAEGENAPRLEVTWTLPVPPATNPLISKPLVSPLIVGKPIIR